MATTWIFHYPDAQERTVLSEVTLSVDKVILLRKPMADGDVESAVAAAQRLYSGNKSPDGAKLTPYKITETVQEAREHVFGKLELFNVAVLEEVPHGDSHPAKSA